MKKNKYTKEELKIVEHVENGRCKSSLDVGKKIKKYQKIFEKNSAKKRAISLRILESDLEKAKAEALRDGMSYQTLIGSVLHKYFNGTLATK